MRKSYRVGALLIVLFLFVISNCSCKLEENKSTSVYGRLQVNITNLSSAGEYSIVVGVFPYSQFERFDTSSNVFAFEHPNIIPDYKNFDRNKFELDSLTSGYYDISLQYFVPIDLTSRFGGPALRRRYKTHVIHRVRIANDSTSIIEATIHLHLIDDLISRMEDLPYIFKRWDSKIIGIQ